jgi:negative regulator of flagellin synthesis FlgM
MVETIGTRLVTGASHIRRAVVGTPTAASPATAPVPSAAAGSIGKLAADLAATPPVDTDRVAQIRQAIRDGSYPIMPARIADSLIASRLEWNATK